MQAHKHVRYLSTASIGHYFGWVGMSGALFWVGRGGWGIILGGWVVVVVGGAGCTV